MRKDCSPITTTVLSLPQETRSVVDLGLSSLPLTVSPILVSCSCFFISFRLHLLSFALRVIFPFLFLISLSFFRRSLFSSPLCLSLVQLSVQDFLGSPGKPYTWQHERLNNPMSYEFGIRNEEQLDDFIEHHLPVFRLVSKTHRIDTLQDQTRHESVCVHECVKGKDVAE